MRLIKDLTIIILFTYGLFYTSYKYGRPDLGLHDFRHYSRMVDSPLTRNVKAPFVLRQIPCIIAYGIKEAGFYYPSKVSFQQSTYYTGGKSQRNFFSLILANYLAFISGLLIMIAYLRSVGYRSLFTPLGLSVGYFWIGVAIIAPMTAGFGWLACSIMSVAVLQRRLLPFIIGSIIALFSRETLLLFFLPLLTIYVVRFKVRYYALAGIVTALCLAALYVLRKVYFHGYEAQLTFGNSLDKIAQFAVNPDNLFQAIFTQGALAYLLYHIYKSDKMQAVSLIAPIVFVAITCTVLVVAGSGRIIGECYPLLVLMYCNKKAPLTGL